MNVKEALLILNKAFEELPFILNKNQEAKWILSYVLNIPIDKIILYSDNLEQMHIDLLYYCINKRSRNYPLDYILKSTYFWKHKFIVSEDTLIPRLDTETLIEAVLSNYPDRNQEVRILDIGTGSGCIIISLLKEYINAKGVATDISPQALKIAKQNADILNISSKIIFLNEDILESDFIFDIVVSNPPYIDINDSDIEISVKTYEPKIALFADNQGLSVYKKIFNNLNKILKKDGKIFIEIGHKQKDLVINIASMYNFKNTEIYQDTARKDRVLVFSYK